MDSSAHDEKAGMAPGSKEPQDKSLYQQRMRAWKPILDPVWVIVTLFAFGIIFVPVGFKLISISDNVVEMSEKYDDYDVPADQMACSITEANVGKDCGITFTAPKHLEPPVLVYYEIDNFYQNHRKYAKSRDDKQLLGSLNQNEAAAKLCDPLNKLGEITLNPCGLIANTLFNDVITLESGVDADGNDLIMIEDGIAWQSDLDFKFAQPDGFKAEACDSCTDCLCESPDWGCKNDEPYQDKNGVCWRYYYPNDDVTQYLHETYPNVTNPIEGVTNEHFVVWMRNAAFPTFRKLYGYIDRPIPAGTKLVFNVNMNWEVRSFKGSKSLVVTTTSAFGGKNPRFGTSFIIVGAVCLGFGIFFALKHLIKPRRLGDDNYLKFKEE